MVWNPLATELTTAATDAVIALLAVAALVVIRGRRAADPWKVDLWSWLLGLLAGASVLGAVAHGFDLRRETADLLWQPLYLLLGLVVALFVVAAVRDRFGERAARRSLPFMVAAGVGFFALTRVASGSFLVFIAYEALAMLASLLLYLDAALRPRVVGAGVMALGVALNLAAAAVQQSPAEAVIAGLPFDHNGLFHLVQMVALGVLTLGVLRSLSLPEPPGVSAT